MCVWVCVIILFILHVRLGDVPAGVTQEEGHTGYLIHLPSAVLALIFLARRIQPFLSLVDREVEFCVQRINRSPLVGQIYIYQVYIFLFVTKNPSSCKKRACVNDVRKIKTGKSKIKNKRLVLQKTLRAMLTEITRTGL